MKRILVIILSLLVVLSVSSFVFGSTGSKSITVTFRNIRILLNGEEKRPALEPFIFNGSTFVPLRFVSESLGFDVGWNGTTNTVSIDYKPNTDMVKSEPVPGAEITVEQYPGPTIIKTKTCTTDDKGNFSFSLTKDEFLQLPDQADFIMTIKVKDPKGFSLEEGASNRVVVRVKKGDKLNFEFTLLWMQNSNQVKSNKGTFAVSSKAQT